MSEAAALAKSNSQKLPENISVEELIKSYIAKLGENIKVARFVRFNVGEMAEPDSDCMLIAEQPVECPLPGAAQCAQSGRRG